MNDIIQKSTLSFNNSQGVVVLTAKQFDTGRKFIFNIVNDDEPYQLDNCAVYLRILKADGTEFQGQECCTIADNEIIVDTSVGNGSQILSSVGKNVCEMHLMDLESEKTLTTWDFIINVDERVHNGEKLQSTDSWDKLDETIKDIEKVESLKDHLTDTNIHITANERNNWDDANSKKHTHSNKSILDSTTAVYTTQLNEKLSNIEDGAEANVSSFSCVQTDDGVLIADAPCSTLGFRAGSNITIGVSEQSNTVIIGAKDTTYNVATSTTDGLMSKEDKVKVDNLAASNVTGVKGSSESSYRTGNINITKANIGLGNVNNTADSDKVVKAIKDLGRHSETASGTEGNATNEGMALESGMFMTESYKDSSAPVEFGNIINVAGAGSGQLFCEWSLQDSQTGDVYYRSHRDTTSGGWGKWKRLANETDISDLKTNFQDGCSKIATAITNNGVSTASNASPATMASNISTLATNKYNAGVSATKKGTAVAGDVLKGKTFTNSSGVNISGSMPDYSGVPTHIDNRRLANGRYEVAVEYGLHGCYWAGNSYEYMELSELASDIGLTADKIVTDESVCGIIGNGGRYNRLEAAYAMDSASLIYGDDWTTSSHNILPAYGKGSITICPNWATTHAIETFILNLPLKGIGFPGVSNTPIYETADHLMLVGEGSASDWVYAYYDDIFIKMKFQMDGTNCWFQIYNPSNEKLYVEWTEGRNLYLSAYI